MSPVAKLAARALFPLIQARRAAYGFANGGEGNQQAGIAQDLAQFAKDYTTAGTNFYQNARNYAQSVIGNPAYQAALNAPGMDTEKVNQMYGSLLPLLYGGSNPLEQAAAQSTLTSTLGAYNDRDFQNGGVNTGLFRDFVKQSPQYSNNPIIRSIFGI